MIYAVIDTNLKHYPKKPQVITPAEFIDRFGTMEEL